MWVYSNGDRETSLNAGWALARVPTGRVFVCHNILKDWEVRYRQQIARLANSGGDHESDALGQRNGANETHCA